MGMVFRSRKQGVVPGGMILLPVGLLLYSCGFSHSPG